MRACLCLASLPRVVLGVALKSTYCLLLFGNPRLSAQPGIMTQPAASLFCP
jgi:hypothetical protein